MSETKQDYQRRIGGLDRPEPDGSEDAWQDTTDALIEAAHGLLCNVDGSAQGWAQSDEWVQAADRWMARYDRVRRDHATIHGIVLRDQTAGALGLCGASAAEIDVRDLAFKVHTHIGDAGCSCDSDVTCPPHEALERLVQHAIQAVRARDEATEK